MLKWLWLSLGVIVLDQFTKYLASTYLFLFKPVAILPMFNLTLMHNPGAAFSFLYDATGWQRWLFTVLALVVSGVLVFWMHRLSVRERWQAVAYAFIVGGALGNVIDRILHGYVVDFIQVYYGTHFFPAFNIADSAITIGATVLIIDLLFLQRQRTEVNT